MPSIGPGTKHVLNIFLFKEQMNEKFSFLSHRYPERNLRGNKEKRAMN